VRGVSKDDLIALMEGPGGFAYAGYCGDDTCEKAIQERTKATTRVLPDEEFRSDPAPATCVWCGRKAVAEAVWARAY
jgi:prolyl-tRNA synthetase